MKPIKTKLAIFDIDGTLTDSVAVHQAAFLQALHKMGFSGFDTDWSAYKHHTDTYIFATIFESWHKRTAIPEDIESFEDVLFSLISGSTNEKPIQSIQGAANFLHQMERHSSFDIVLATGSLFRPARLKLEQSGISIPDELLTSANRWFSRDELVSTAIETAMSYYGNTYGQVISFGDGRWDYETAKNLHIDFIGIQDPRMKALDIQHFFSDYTDPQLFRHLGLESGFAGDNT